MVKPSRVMIAIAWCLAWGNEKTPQNPALMAEVKRALSNDNENLPAEFENVIKQVQEIDNLDIKGTGFPNTLEKLKDLSERYAQLWKSRIGLVYGGATKIKQYVFEETRLPEIRGASALLDRINLIDLPAFFSCETSTDYEACQQAGEFCQNEVRRNWLDKEENFPELSSALIPQLVIYSTGGNILAFCPAGLIDDLANAIEKRYTFETLTANSCAVGDTFSPLEIHLGILPKEINQDTFWVEKYQKNLTNPLVIAYFQQEETRQPQDFANRKNFNELAGKLASLSNQRRNGNKLPRNERLQENERPLRCYPPMLETHPYLKRDEGERRSAVYQAKSSPDDISQGLPGDPWMSEASARKRLVGQIAKREVREVEEIPKWYQQSRLTWKPGDKKALKSWVNKFKEYLDEPSRKELRKAYYGNLPRDLDVKEAMSVREIGDACITPGFVAYIYADGNNMGGYIQKEIKTPEKYFSFSKDLFNATEKSVYLALAKHLEPHKLNSSLQAERGSSREIWIHPFEILAIGGDDVMLIVPADKALEIAKTIGEEFEKILLSKGRDYELNQGYTFETVHRYRHRESIQTEKQCKLSMSTGVLITSESTPIYYTEQLTSQLLKSAKKRAKELKKEEKYCGGTVDFLVMKSVTMISSNVNEFRSDALTKLQPGTPKLKLYAAPYTLHELSGLLKTLQALKDSDFPKSQIYQIRSLLERGKQTAILNYRYFRVRLANKESRDLLEKYFEEAWCLPKEEKNSGNLAPWMSLAEVKEKMKNQDSPVNHKKPENLQKQKKMTYETIWRDLVDLYPFIQKTDSRPSLSQSQERRAKV